MDTFAVRNLTGGGLLPQLRPKQLSLISLGRPTSPWHLQASEFALRGVRPIVSSRQSEEICTGLFRTASE